MAIAQFVSNRRTCCLLLTGYKLLSPYDVHVFQPFSVVVYSVDSYTQL